MNAIEAAIYAKIEADTQLKKAGTLGSTGTFYLQADPEVKPPYVVFHPQAPTADAYTLGRRAWSEALITIKAIAAGPSAKLAGQFSDRIDAVFSLQDITVTGFTHLICRREQEVEYPEDEDGVTYHHAGGVFRFMEAA